MVVRDLARRELRASVARETTSPRSIRAEGARVPAPLADRRRAARAWSAAVRERRTLRAGRAARRRQDDARARRAARRGSSTGRSSCSSRGGSRRAWRRRGSRAERGGELGGEVGYEVRFDRKTRRARRGSSFVTEGVLTRRLLGDPELRGVGCVVIDEFHERHLDGDLALALVERLRARAARAAARRDVGDARCRAGRRVPRRRADRARPRAGRSRSTIEHAAQPDDRHARQAGRGGGAARSRRKASTATCSCSCPAPARSGAAPRTSSDRARRVDLAVVPLHGDLPAEEQDARCGPPTRRKVILATNVAETSVTIDGVTCVIDSGLARIARHSPWAGCRASRSSRSVARELRAARGPRRSHAPGPRRAPLHEARSRHAPRVRAARDRARRSRGRRARAARRRASACDAALVRAAAATAAASAARSCSSGSAPSTDGAITRARPAHAALPCAPAAGAPRVEAEAAASRDEACIDRRRCSARASCGSSAAVRGEAASCRRRRI